MGLMKIRTKVVCYLYLSSSFLVAYILGEFTSIQPNPCESRMTGETGICTFNWFCVNVANGVHIGPCMDRFFIGSCCKIPHNSSFVGKQPIRNSHGETETPKEDSNLESFSKITVFTPRVPSKQEVKFPNLIQKNFTESINSETHYVYANDHVNSTPVSQRNTDSYLPSIIPFSYLESPSKIPLISHSRKPVMQDTPSPTTSSYERNNFVSYTQKFNGENTFTPDFTHKTHFSDQNIYSFITKLLQHNSSSLQSSHKTTGVEEFKKNDNPFQHNISVFTQTDHILNHIIFDQNIQNSNRTAEHENIEKHISFAFDDNKHVSLLGHHNDKQKNNTFLTWAYSFLKTDKNVTYAENNTSSTEVKLNTVVYQYLSTPGTINSSQQYLSGLQHENNSFNIELDSTITEIDASSSATSTEYENSVNIENVLLNFTKFSELSYPWPSAKPYASEDSIGSTSEAKVRNISKVCGRSRSNIVARIVGGRKSHYLRWPWMISLRRFEGKTFKHKCGAALLNQLWVITAAHCVDGKLPNDMILRLGEYNFHRSDEFHSHLERRIYTIVIHPEFDPATYENDLALLRFYEPVSFRANIVPVCLPKFTGDLAGRTAVVTGWGRLSEEGELPGPLHEVQMPILTNKECEEMYSQVGYSETIKDVFVCAGRVSGGLDACEGDSGGPMVVRGERGEWTLVGLISWGMGCAAPRQPGVYTRITKFVDWIDEIISL